MVDEYRELDHTITEYAWFLALMTKHAKESGDHDPVRHIERVANLQPEKLITQAEAYDGVANFYHKIGTVGLGQLDKLGDAWESDAADKFSKLFKLVCEYVAGKDRSLDRLAWGTAAQLRDTAETLLLWQKAIAKVIREAAKEWEGALDRSVSELADMMGLDPFNSLAQFAQGFWWGLTQVNNEFEENATKGVKSAGAEASYKRLNSARLSEHYFERELKDIPHHA